MENRQDPTLTQYEWGKFETDSIANKNPFVVAEFRAPGFEEAIREAVNSAVHEIKKDKKSEEEDPAENDVEAREERLEIAKVEAGEENHEEEVEKEKETSDEDTENSYKFPTDENGTETHWEQEQKEEEIVDEKDENSYKFPTFSELVLRHPKVFRDNKLRAEAELGIAVNPCTIDEEGNEKKSIPFDKESLNRICEYGRQLRLKMEEKEKKRMAEEDEKKKMELEVAKEENPDHIQEVSTNSTIPADADDTGNQHDNGSPNTDDSLDFVFFLIILLSVFNIMRIIFL